MTINSSLLEAEMTIAQKCFDKKCSAETPNEHTLIKPGGKVKVHYTFQFLRITVENQTFPNLFKCLQVAALIPISSASCERSFSAMRRLNKMAKNFKETREILKSISVVHREEDVKGNHIL